MMTSVLKLTGRAGFFLIILLHQLLASNFAAGQVRDNDSILVNATLDNIVRYAMRHNPALKNSIIGEEITETFIRSRLADWYPQLNFSYTLQHTFQLPTANINGQLINTGLPNTSGAQFGVTQNVFNRDVLLASRTAKDVRRQSQQNTAGQKINLAVLVSKAFYDVILTIQQLHVVDEDINRISISLKDAFYQYQGGVTDKTDYKRATIALNNAKAQKKNGEESLKSKYGYLKELIGYPRQHDFDLRYDTAELKTQVFFDTLQAVSYANRIEYQQLQTQKTLALYNLSYARWSFLPDVSLFANYNMNYQNRSFSKIYSQNFPNSYAGLLFSVPIFQGGKRLQQIKQARFQLLQVDNSIIGLENTINTQYTQALASYKSNLANYLTQEENVALAREVYDVIRLQYRSGVKTYLEVINSETDLRTAQINLYNALYQVLSSKVDVQQSLGTISY